MRRNCERNNRELGLAAGDSNVMNQEMHPRKTPETGENRWEAGRSQRRGNKGQGINIQYIKGRV